MISKKVRELYSFITFIISTLLKIVNDHHLSLFGATDVRPLLR